MLLGAMYSKGKWTEKKSLKYKMKKIIQAKCQAL